MDAPVAGWDRAVPDRQSHEPEVSEKQQAEILEFRLPDARSTNLFGKRQVNDLLYPPDAGALAAQKAEAQAEQRWERALEALLLLLGASGIALALWFWPT